MLVKPKLARSILGLVYCQCWRNDQFQRLFSARCIGCIVTPLFLHLKDQFLKISNSLGEGQLIGSLTKVLVIDNLHLTGVRYPVVEPAVSA